MMRWSQLLGAALCAFTILTVTGCVQGFLSSIQLKIEQDNAPEPRLFWTDRTDNVIQSSNLEGEDVKDVLNLPGLLPYVLEIDRNSGRMYWSSTGPTPRVRRARLDGGDVEDLVTSGLASEVHGIALDVNRGWMYCTDNTHLYKIPLDGGTKNAADYVLSLEDTLGFTVTLYNASGIAINLSNDRIYFCDRGGVVATIYRAALDGTETEGLILTGLDTPRDIEVDAAAQLMYWVDSGAGAIYAATIISPDGDASNHELITGLSEPYGLALDPARDRLYWTDVTDDTIYRVRLNGTNQASLPVPGLADANDIELYY